MWPRGPLYEICRVGGSGRKNCLKSGGRETARIAISSENKNNREIKQCLFGDQNNVFKNVSLMCDGRRRVVCAGRLLSNNENAALIAISIFHEKLTVFLHKNPIRSHLLFLE